MTGGSDELKNGHIPVDVLEQLLETSPIGIVLVDSSGAIVFVNDRIADLVPDDAPTFVGQSVFDERWELTTVDGTDIGREDHPFEHALNGETTDRRRLVASLPERERVVLRMSTSPIRADDTVVYAVGIVEDITRLDQREQELTAKNRQLESLASVLSHDLRNPLAIARGYTDLVAETGDLSFLAKVENAHDRMEELVDSLLLLARRGHAIGKREPVSLNTAAADAWQSVQTESASLTVDIDGDHDTVVADRVRLQQLFENLFRNSVEHGRVETDSEHDALTVTVRSRDAGEGFVVADDGVGIPALEATALSTYLDGRDETDGLGLKIVCAIADAHGWQTVLEPGERHGVCFSFDTSAASDDE